MTACIITGGLAPSLEQVTPLIEASSYILCADSGFDTACRWGVTPHEVIGDMDSVEATTEFRKAQSQGRTLIFPEDKDLSDTELALVRCKKKGFSKIVLIGGGGGRFDHQLALFYSFFLNNHADLWITEKEEIRPILNYHIFTGTPGERVSFFPVSSGMTCASSKGLKWALDGLEWGPGQFGISNRLMGDKAEVTVKNGRLVMIRDIYGKVTL